jgi:ribosomal protein S19E (S16A)
MTVAKRKSSTDDKVEAKRKIIRRSLDELKAQVEQEMLAANIRSPINIVVPSCYSLVTIGGTRDLPPEQWVRMSEIVRRIVGERLGGNKLRGRPLARATATAKLIAADVTPD